jgi:hypothetical protein
VNRCAACDELIAPTDVAHEVHEDGCEADWCVCETAFVHPWCCRSCHPVQVPGQVDAFADLPPLASTRGLPKGRSV